MSEAYPVENRRLVLLACMSGLFMAAVEATIVATAMPTIVAQLGGFDLFGWVFGAYLLPQAVTVPIYGRLADLYGRKPMFFIGAAIFLFGSTLCGLARSMLWLILFRAVQGLGAGAIMPIAQTIVADTYPPSERARIQSYLSSVWGVAAIAGPMLGAFIVQHLNWALVFWVNLPLGALAMGLLALFLREERRAVHHVLDVRGAVLIALSAGSLMLALLQSDRLGWAMLPLLAFSAVTGLLLVIQERQAPEPMLPLVLWRNRTIAVANLANLILGALMMGISAFLPTYVQGVMGRDATASGVALAFMTLAWPVAGSIAARLMGRVSHRLIASSGGAIIVAGTAILLTIRPTQNPAILYLASGAIGLGMGFYSLTFLLSVQAAASWHVRGIATSSIVFMRTVGQALGTAVLGAVLNLGLARRLPQAGNAVQTLMDPAQRSRLPSADIGPLVHAVASSLHEVYIVVVLLAVMALAVTQLTPTTPQPVAAE